MQVDEVNDVQACLPSAQFLSAEELSLLRKPSEENNQPAIGEKLYTHSDSLVAENALKCALENYKETLDKKRAVRICDLMQGEWNPELNIVTVPKLKGKFAQHVGRLVNGQYILAPEEAVFLLENSFIEIKNGETLLSSEEAFNMILKGNLGLEKYQVYSHLCNLGYITVSHQSDLDVPDNEEEMDAVENTVKKKRQMKEPAEGEPVKKRLTFTGALSEESPMKTTSDASKENSPSVSMSEISAATSMEETKLPERSEHDVADKSSDNVKHIPLSVEEQNGDGAIIDKDSEDIQSDIDKINCTSVNNNELEAMPENKDNGTLEEINSSCDFKSVEEKENVGEAGKNTMLNEINSQNLNEAVENSKLQKDNESRDSNSQSSKIVDVMDVDTDETSSGGSQLSQFRAYYYAGFRDPCDSVNNDEKTQGETNPGSNVDVLSSSDFSSEEDDDIVLNVDDVAPREDDDEVTLLEVTKKETKPLAVIDLLSDDDDDENETVNVVDDDITFLEEYPIPSMGKPTSSREINSKKLNGCKKEEKGVDVSTSKSIPPLTVQLPDLLRKSVVCIARPPLHLLPNHVKPSKEAYVLNLKTRNPDQPSSNNRVWNSYREMQDYQRQRRQNRHQNNNPRGQPFSGPQTWNDKNSRFHDRPHRPVFGPNQGNSPDVNSNSRGFLGPPPVDFNRNLFSANSFQNNLPSSNPTTMNCEVTFKEDTSESLVGNSNQSSHSHNFSLSSGIPNNPLMNQLVPNNFMAGIQRNSFSMDSVSHSHLMAELQRTCFTVATNVLSSMLNRNPSLLPNPAMPMFPPGLNQPSSFNPNMSNGYNNSFNLPSSNDNFSLPHQNFGGQQRRVYRGRPFPCRYRNIGNKQSWSDVRSAMCDSSSDSDIEEMPVSPRDILWDRRGFVPLVKSGVQYPKRSVFKFLQMTHEAKISCKNGYPSKLINPITTLEISFDVYPPAFIYRRTCPQIPKYRVIVLRSTDPVPKPADLAPLQQKWNDGATLLIAVNDNGDISFQSFNSISLPLMIPHED